MKKFLNKDRVLSIILLAISLFFAFNTNNLKASNYVGDPGPKMFPYMGAVICVICAVILFIKPAKGSGRKFLTKAEAKDVAMLLGVYALIFLLMWLIGYTVTVPIILFILCFMFSKVTDPEIPAKKNIIRSIIYAVIVSIGLYALYVLVLKTQLPHGLLIEMLKK